MANYIDLIDSNGNEWTRTTRFREAKETIAAQAAVIESLKSALIKFGLHKLSCDYVEQHRGGRFEGSDGVCDCGFSDALAIPTDSTQILDEVRRAERGRVAEFILRTDLGKIPKKWQGFAADGLFKYAEAIRAME